MSEDAPANARAVLAGPFWPGITVRSMQTKLHRWAGEDLPAGSVTCSFRLRSAFLVHVWERCEPTEGAQTARG